MTQQYDTRTAEEIAADQPSELQELEQLYCEMHKDVYGVKARWYRAESVEQARKDIERLGEELDRVMAEEAYGQQVAIADFLRFAEEHCGGDVETAKRWQHDAYGTQGDDEFLEYRLGLPYGFFKRAAVAA